MFGAAFKIVLLIIIITFVIEFIIRKKFAIHTEFPRRPINTTYKWVNRIFVPFIVLIMVWMYIFSINEMFVFVFIGLVILHGGFNAFMEYKYEPEEKEYVISLVWLSAILIMFFIVLFFTLKTTTFDAVIKDYSTIHPKEMQHIEVENKVRDKEKITYKRKADIEDKQKVEKLFSKLSKVKVRNSMLNEGIKDNYYDIYVENSEIYAISVYEQYLAIDSDYYKVIGDNDIYKMLEEEKLDWVNEE